MNNSVLFPKGFKVPCPLNCELRRPACQDHCEKMIEAKKAHEENKKKLKELKHMDYVINMTPKRDRRR